MVTLGADPELFLRDTRTGAATSCVGLIGGTKKNPLAMVDLPEGFAVQEDNVMVEFNIPAVSTGRRFAQRIDDGVEYIRQLVRTSLPNHDLDIGACTRLFSMDELANKQAQVFGCSPDFNAHMQGNPCPTVKPDALMEGDNAWRFAGGHVHLGYESEAPDFVAAAFADVFLGLPSVGLDEQGLRRGLYGQAGRYRPTSYGIEYRTLSNFWIWDQRLAQSIGEKAWALANLLERDAGEIQRLYSEIPWIDVQQAINSENEEKAADLIAYISNDLEIGGI